MKTFLHRLISLYADSVLKWSHLQLRAHNPSVWAYRAHTSGFITRVRPHSKYHKGKLKLMTKLLIKIVYCWN